jgi:hypothetical protein
VINKNGTVIVNAINPHGIQAVLIRPDTFGLDATTGEVLLKDGSKIAFEKNLINTMQNLIANKKIVAATITPNLFNIDPSTITNPEDYVKLNECRDTSSISNNPNINNGSITSNPNLITWILVGIAILLILFLLFRK